MERAHAALETPDPSNRSRGAAVWPLSLVASVQRAFVVDAQGRMEAARVHARNRKRRRARLVLPEWHAAMMEVCACADPRPFRFSNSVPDI